MYWVGRGITSPMPYGGGEGVNGGKYIGPGVRLQVQCPAGG